jgi:hypothetical protein
MRKLLILLPLLLTVGCAHTVQYKLTKSDHSFGSPVDAVLRVTTLADQTVPTTEKTVEEPPYTWRTNYRDKYKDKEIDNGVTAMVIKHLRESGLFKDVIGQNNQRHADMELSGSIAEYSARGRVNKGAENSVMTGALLGSFIGVALTSAATSGEKTEIRATVTLRDLTLRDAASTNVLWHDTITVSTNFTDHWSAADEEAVFQHADNCLKSAVEELIHLLAEALKGKTGNSQ